MDFWNMAVPGLTFMAPMAAILFFLFQARRVHDAEKKIGLALFGLMMLVAVIGIVRFERPVRMEFLWQLTLEPSGYFEFSLQMHWLRYVWILFSAAAFFGFVAYDGPDSLGSDRRSLRFLFLTGSFLFSALAYLSENVLLSLLFLEISAFLLHAFGVEMGGKEEELEKISYFKRSCFIFLGLVTMLGLAATGLFATNSIILMGVVLYVMAQIFSKHNFVDWRYLSLSLVQVGAIFFLLGQVLHDQVSAELWVPLAAVFALSAMIFSALSFLSLSALNATFWLVLAFLGFLLFLRFSSAKPTDAFWGTYEAIGMASAFALGTIFRLGARMDLLWKRVLAFTLQATLLGIVSGAIPGVEAIATKLDGETSLVKVLTLGFLTFLVSAVAGKALFVSFQQEEHSSGETLLTSFVPAFLVLLMQLGSLLLLGDLYGENLFTNLLFLFYDPRSLVTGSALGLGLLCGALLGSNSRFMGWIRGRERRMEDLFPRIDPIVVRWNEGAAHAPERAMEWMSQWVNKVGIRGAGLLEGLDRGVFGERFFRGFGHYGASLSLFVRFFHSGNVRMYMFLGVLITLLSSFFFLLEGR